MLYTVHLCPSALIIIKGFDFQMYSRAANYYTASYINNMYLDICRATELFNLKDLHQINNYCKITQKRSKLFHDSKITHNANITYIL